LSIKVPKDVLVIDLKKQPYQTLQLQIEQLSQVESVSATNWLPMFFSTTDCKLQIANKTHQIQYINIDPTMVQIANIQLLAGHNFSKIDAMSKIERYILVNESAAKLIAKKPVDAVNKYVAIDSSNIQIIGVVSNESIPELMPEPCIVRYLPNDFSRLAIKIKPNSAATVTTACQKIWHNNVSQKTLHLYDYRTHLKSSSNFNSILYFFGFFCAIVMVIACLGILGVAAYSVEVRTKEVGIRKALGANNGQLVWTISKDFGKLLLYSGVVGIPAGWFCGTLLRNRMGDAVDLRPYNLLIGFGLVLAVGLITSQTLRAGQINPAEVLKMD
jgi:ABC-type antimicrobial peptide transport system permease subunit